MTTWDVRQGDCRELLRAMPAESVHCVVTSPPYWGLRDYGVPPLVWGGDEGCEHEWGEERRVKSTAQQDNGPGGGVWNAESRGTEPSSRRTEFDASGGQFCRHCHAWRGSLGLEPTPELYIEHMVEIFREVKRVLRKDATCWVNMGDSYAGGNGQRGGDGSTSRLGPKATDSEWTRSQQAMRTSGQGVMKRAPGLKPKDLCGMPWRLAFALQADGWWLRSEIIWHKCLSGGARVYAKTQKGEMPMTIKDMVRLDPATVKLWDGEKWNQAAGWEPVERKGDELEIELRSGERIGCTREHRWPTNNGLISAGKLAIGDVIYQAALADPASPRMPSALLDSQVAWFVGLYLAEGSQSDGTIQIASNLAEQGRYQRLAELAAAFDGYCFQYQTSENGMTININSPVLLGIIKTYISGRVAKDKHLHVRCWQRGYAFLQDLLGGYLEGDGSQAGEGYWRLGFTQNDALAADLRTLAARLGYSLRLRRRISYIDKKPYPGWRGDLRIRQEARRSPDSQIVAIRRSRARKFWHITLEEEPHLFALASGVLTHNSNPMPESVRDRPTKAHETVFLLTKSARYYYDAEAIRESSKTTDPRRPYTSQGAWEMDGRAPEQRHSGERRNGDDFTTRNRRTVWTIPTAAFPGAHFATFPPALIEPMILTSPTKVCAVCGTGWERVTAHEGGDAETLERPKRRAWISSAKSTLSLSGNGSVEWAKRGGKRTTLGFAPACDCPGLDGDGPWIDCAAHPSGEDNWPSVPATVLDIFSGASTTILVALRHGRNAVGLELSPEYCEMGRQRVIDDNPMFNGTGV